MTKQAIEAELRRVLEEMDARVGRIGLERPRDRSLGDVATNVALALASRLRRPPRAIAQEIRRRVDRRAAGVSSVEVAGPGFLNFRYSAGSLSAQLAKVIARGPRYGSSEEGAGRKIMVEFVSANPTGPLHLGHARQAALGDAISSLLEFQDWSVHREYYYNDAGLQIDRLADSVHARYRQRLGKEDEVPADGYRGSYVAEIAAALAGAMGPSLLARSPANLDRVKRFAVNSLRTEQDDDLRDFGVRFDRYYLESSLYESQRVAEAISEIRKKGQAYEADGAIWLRATSYGDRKDRVMVRRDGRPTYFAADVAYHRHKWERGFRHAINVQGADHHGTVARVRAGLQALGLPEGYPEYVLHSMVRVTRSGAEVKASKRSGEGVTMREIVGMAGVDVARYFFLMSKPDAHMTFDLDRALDKSEKNPVYKVQYAHARLFALFEKGGIPEESVTSSGADLSLLVHDEERSLLRTIVEFPETVERAARSRSPHLVCSYLGRLAGAANAWYHSGHPIRAPERAALVSDPALRGARLVLARACRIVLGNGLRALGVSAPERM